MLAENQRQPQLLAIAEGYSWSQTACGSQTVKQLTLKPQLLESVELHSWSQMELDYQTVNQSQLSPTGLLTLTMTAKPQTLVGFQH